MPNEDLLPEAREVHEGVWRNYAFTGFGVQLVLEIAVSAVFVDFNFGDESKKIYAKYELLGDHDEAAKPLREAGFEKKATIHQDPARVHINYYFPRFYPKNDDEGGDGYREPSPDPADRASPIGAGQ